MQEHDEPPHSTWLEAAATAMHCVHCTAALFRFEVDGFVNWYHQAVRDAGTFLRGCRAAGYTLDGGYPSIPKHWRATPPQEG